jgi:colanic acid/amylovoran biosynthesis glycosyltransferase
MKVLHVVHPFLRISENWIYPQITQVPGVEPGVLTSHRENDQQFPARGIHFIHDPPRWSTGAGIPRLLNSLFFRLGWRGFFAGHAIKRWRPDLIHAHFGQIGWETLAIRAQLGVPLVCSFYGMDAWQLPFSQPEWIGRYRRLFAEGSIFLVEGPAMRERLVAIGCPREKVSICRIGVPVENLPFSAKPPGKPLRIVMIARFVEKKGFEDGLAACIAARKLGVDLAVEIIGDGNDAVGARIKAQLQLIAASPELNGRVTFHGFLKPAEARAIICASDVFLCPSKMSSDGDAEGGSPVALTEAMALGLLCIGTRHCDIPEVIRHGETGLLAEPGDIAGLAALIAKADANPDEMLALRTQGREHVVANFSGAQQLRELRAAYDRFSQEK